MATKRRVLLDTPTTSRHGAVAAHEREALAEGILPGPQLLRQRLLDDDDRRGSLTIVCGEAAAAKDPHPHRVEEPRRDGVESRVAVAIERQAVETADEYLGGLRRRKGRALGRGRAFDTGQRREFGQRSLVEALDRFVVVAGAAHRQRADEHAILVMPEVERTEPLNRPQEESAADEEQCRQHDLRRRAAPVAGARG